MFNILLVEDDKSLSVGLVYFLNKEGYHVTHTETVLETLRVLENKYFDLAILDVTLPDGESFDLAPEIKEKNIPTIFLTAKDEEKDILKGFDSGAEDYITKPFSIKVLGVRIKKILERFKDYQGHKRISGDLTVDMQSLKVYNKDKSIDLTQTEFKLLNYFMDNYNIALTRDQILEFLWDSDAEFQAYSTISVYINRLREKIEDEATDSRYIVTKRGSGYMWAVEVE